MRRMISSASLALEMRVDTTIFISTSIRINMNNRGVRSSTRCNSETGKHNFQAKTHEKLGETKKSKNSEDSDFPN